MYIRESGFEQHRDCTNIEMIITNFVVCALSPQVFVK